MWLRARARAALTVGPLVALACVAASMAVGTVAHADDGVRWFEGDPAVVSADVHAQPVELNVGLIMDCDGTSTPPECGEPPARWAMEKRPVAVCSFAAGRPSWLSEAQFRQAMTDAAATWNRVEAAVSVRYTGECVTGSRWVFGNGINEIGFDDARDVVRGDASGVTRANTMLSPPLNPTQRLITEADIVIDNTFANQPTCFATTVTHELGHVLGFGHSDIPGDLMFRSYNPASPLGCPPGPSSAEQTRLRELYGVNRAPVVSVNAPPTARSGVPVSATAAAVDPEGEAVIYEWSQVGGPPVALSVAGATVTFTPPATPGVVLLRVVATDASLHTASTTVSVTVTLGLLGTARISGALPPNGFGLFVFSGGTEAQLLTATGCPTATAAFWVSDGVGGFATFVPGTAIAAVNSPWLALFPSGLPDNTALLGRCRP